MHQAFRRAGQNPDEDKVHGIINELDQDGSGKVQQQLSSLSSPSSQSPSSSSSDIKIFMTKVEWPEFAACLAEMMKGDEEETAYRECFRWILLLFAPFHSSHPKLTLGKCQMFYPDKFTMDIVLIRDITDILSPTPPAPSQSGQDPKFFLKSEKDDSPDQF